MVDRSRLMVDTRKWLLSKMFPKKYGDKIDATLSGPDGGPIQQSLTVEYVRQKQALLTPSGTWAISITSRSGWR
jgi:hypothetical protein